MKTPSHLSPSGLSTWRQCPQKYVHGYLEDHPPKPETIEMLRGTFVHSVLERLAWFPAELRTTENAKEIGRRLSIEWIELGTEPGFTALGLDLDGLAHFFAWTWASILTAFEFVGFPTLEVAATELRLDLELGGVGFRGFIDVVTVDPDGLSVGDYKTGEKPEQGKPWSQRTADEKLLQPLLYGAALREMGLTVSRVALLHIPADGRAGVLGCSADDASLDGAVVALQEAWVEIEAVAAGEAEAETKPSALCGWCDFLDICPEGQREVETRISLGRSVPSAAVKVVMG